jgi:transcriptional regulator with XRE-family HTH domain
MEKISEIIRRQLSQAVETETLRSIADRAGLDHTQLSRFRTGERTLRQGALDELCKALGLTVTPLKTKRRKGG